MSEDFLALAGLRAGSLLAGYRLEAQVGAGGMAAVFRARDQRLGRLVALKILAPAAAVLNAVAATPSMVPHRIGCQPAKALAER